MKKVGELHNIPIVEGDPNLLTKKQLLYKDGILSKRDSTGDIKNLGNNVQGGSGGNGGGSGEEIGLIYVTKEAILEAFGVNSSASISQEEFKGMLFALYGVVGIRAIKDKNGRIYGIESDVENAIYEEWLTFENWSATALYLDTPMIINTANSRLWVKTWMQFGETIEEAKAMLEMIFPVRLTEDEFLKYK